MTTIKLGEPTEAQMDAYNRRHAAASRTPDRARQATEMPQTKGIDPAKVSALALSEPDKVTPADYAAYIESLPDEALIARFGGVRANEIIARRAAKPRQATKPAIRLTERARKMTDEQKLDAIANGEMDTFLKNASADQILAFLGDE